MERNPIRVGLLAGEPIRLEGLATVFEQEPLPGRARLLPVVGSLGDLLADEAIEYLVIDLSSPSGRLETLAEIRGVRPQLRLIVIGPEGNDELLLDSITAGARAYLAGTAGPDMVRQAIEVVVSGSIWAPRRLLSQLIDRMLEMDIGISVYFTYVVTKTVKRFEGMPIAELLGHPAAPAARQLRRAPTS